MKTKPSPVGGGPQRARTEKIQIVARSSIYSQRTNTYKHADHVPAGPDQLPPAHQQDGVGQGPRAEGHRVRFCVCLFWVKQWAVVTCTEICGRACYAIHHPLMPSLLSPPQQELLLHGVGRRMRARGGRPVGRAVGWSVGRHDCPCASYGG